VNRSEPDDAAAQAVLRAAPRPGELVLARTAVLAVAALAVPVLGVAALAEGAPGAYGAAAGLGLVLVLFGVAAALQAWAARFDPTTAAAVLLGGFGLRLVVYLLALIALSGVERLHRPSLAIATAVAFVATLGVEMRQVSRSPQLFWLGTAPDGATEGDAR
jgi:hypothetical protein